MDDITVLPLRAALIMTSLLAALILGVSLWGLLGGPVAAQVAFDLILFTAAVLGYNLFTGTTGYISFGHGLFYALGGYTAIVLVPLIGKTGSLLAAGAVNALLALLLLGPLLRTRGPYFAISSLAIFLAMGGVVTLIPGLGGSEGLAAPPGMGMSTREALVAASLLALSSLVASLLVGVTRRGKLVIAVRDNEEAARAIGVNPLPYRLTMLALSGFILGAAGGTYFLSYGGRGYIDPELAFDPRTNTLIVLAAVAGGVGSLTGVTIAALLVKTLDNLIVMYAPALAAIISLEASRATIFITITPYIVFGLLVAVIAVATPRGLHGILERLIHARLLVGLRAAEKVESERGARSDA